MHLDATILTIFLTNNWTNFVHCRVIINWNFAASEQPMAYRYGRQPTGSANMISSRPKKCRYTVLAHTVSLRALG